MKHILTIIFLVTSLSLFGQKTGWIEIKDSASLNGVNIENWYEILTKDTLLTQNFTVGSGQDFDTLGAALEYLTQFNIVGDVKIDVTEDQNMDLTTLVFLNNISGSGSLTISGENYITVEEAVTFDSASYIDPFKYYAVKTWTPDQYKYLFYRQGSSYYPITENGTNTLSITDEGRTAGDIVSLDNTITISLGGETWFINPQIKITINYLNVVGLDEGSDSFTFQSGNKFTFSRSNVNLQGYVVDIKSEAGFVRSSFRSDFFQIYEAQSQYLLSFLDIENSVDLKDGAFFKIADNVIEASSIKEAFVTTNSEIRFVTSARRLKVQNCQCVYNLYAGGKVSSNGAGVILSNVDYIFEINTAVNADARIPSGEFLGTFDIAVKKDDVGVGYNASIDNDYFVYAEDFETPDYEITQLTVNDSINVNGSLKGKTNTESFASSKTIDFSLQHSVEYTVTGNTTITIQDIPQGFEPDLSIILDGTGGYTITISGATKATNTNDIDNTASKINLVQFKKINDTVYWFNTVVN